MFDFRGCNLAPVEASWSASTTLRRRPSVVVGAALCLPHRIFGTEALVVQPTAFVRLGAVASDTPQDFN